MGKHAWVSISSKRPGEEYGFGWPEDGLELNERVARGNALLLDGETGQSLPASRFSSVLETEGKPYRVPKVLGDYVRWTYPVVSERLADALRQADLGPSNLYPATLYQRDKDLTFDQSFFILNIGVCKEALDDEQTTMLDPTTRPGTHWLKYTIKADDVVLKHNAAEGPDIWVDPKLPRKTYFFSDRLYQILKKENLAKALGLVRCRIAD
jgi:hypothetical protein